MALLRRVIRSFQPDIVHSSGWFSYSAAAALLGSAIPLLVSFRDYGYICANVSLLHKGDPCSGPGLAKCFNCSQDYVGGAKGPIAVIGVWASKYLLRHQIAATHSVSRFVDESVVPLVLGPRYSKVLKTVIPSFRLNEDGTVPSETPPKLPVEPFILFVGALRRVKGVETLFAAYERLDNPPPVVLMGTFEEDTPTELPAGAIAVSGVGHADVMASWDRSLFGVLPSLWPEPFGTVVHVAMSRGKAVIGTVPGGRRDMIDHGRNGLLVRSGDVDGLREAIQLLLNDPEMRERLGRAATDQIPRLHRRRHRPQAR